MDTVITPPPRTSSAAVWSLVLGILSMFCLWLLGSIPAIILGVLALNKINAQPTVVSGREIAISGIVTGAVGILTGLFAVGIAASIAMPAYNGIQDRGARTKDISDIGMIWVGCLAFASDNDGQYPKDLRELYPNFLESEELFKPRDGSLPGIDRFSYRPGLTNASQKQVFILGPDRGLKRTVGYTDGSVEENSEPLPPDILSEFQ